MKTNNFCHLHVHSMYSLLDGLPKIDQLVNKAKEYEMEALALTDHGVMYGIIEFYKKCKEAGIRPILGCEVYLAPRTIYDKQPKIDNNPYHLVLLAKNNEGYQNLIKLSTIAHLEGYYYNPRLDKEVLKKYSSGLICLSSCLGGEIPIALLSGDFEKAEKLVAQYQDIFGKDHFYLEIQDHPNITEQNLVNQKIIELAKATHAPIVATNDVHYIDFKDREAHEVLLCIQTGRTYDDPNRLSMKEEDYSFKSPKQMAEAFSHIPEAIENTQKIAHMCNVEIELGKYILPKYPLPKGETEDSYFKRICQEGLEARFGRNITKEVKERLEEEIATIKKAGFIPYFLIVADFVRYAKEKGIRKGPGRGSSAGSLVSYVLGITDINPLEYGLLFERFLSKEGERVAPPDIDLDFAEDRRGEVIEYLVKKYGKERVAQIITFGTMAARAAVRDVARVLGMSYSQGDEIAKLIPFGVSLEEALRVSPMLFERYKNESQVKRLIDLAMQLEGVARHASTHAAGVVIGREDLTSRVPLQKEVGKEENIITQYSMYDLEDLGLLKIDILGLANLTIIGNTLRILKKTRNLDLDITKVPLDDKKVYQLLSSGHTHGVFQLESEGMRKWLTQLKPTKFTDIIAMIALYRPGPLAWIPEYIAAKHARKKPSYLHPKLEPILKSTYGVPIYQEQVMQIARDLAGFSYSEADVLRKAIGKKIKRLLIEQKDKFIQGCIKNGISEEIAQKVFQFIEPFARYSFNKSHATCYAFIAYWTAYLKSHFPSEYMAAFLTNEQKDIDKLSLAIAECERMKIKVLPPNVNESWPEFAVVPATGNIRFGLAAIKNVGEKAAEMITEERKKNGLYKSLEDFLIRSGPQVINKKILESLIKAGALDDFGERTALLAGVDQLLRFASQKKKRGASSQLGLFAHSENSLSLSNSLPKVPPASKSQKLKWEKELLGMYLSEHPLSEFNHIWEKGEILPISSLSLSLVGQKVEVAGIVNKIQRAKTRNGLEMVFITLEDISGSIEAIVFPKILDRKPELIQKDKIVKIKGRVSEKEGGLKLIVDEIDSLQEFQKSHKSYTGFYITLPPHSDKELLKQIKRIALEHPGRTPLYLRVIQNNEIKEFKTKSRVKICEPFLRKLITILGADKIELK